MCVCNARAFSSVYSVMERIVVCDVELDEGFIGFDSYSSEPVTDGRNWEFLRCNTKHPPQLKIPPQMTLNIPAAL